MRTALETAQTNRARVRDLMVGSVPRSAAVIAGIDVIIAAYALTAINSTTFGAFKEGLAGNDVCAITSTDKTVTSVDAPFGSAVAGMIFHMAGAGAAGGTLVTRIASVTSASEIELEDAAATTVAPSTTSAAGLAMWGYPLNDLSDYNILPTGAATWDELDNVLGNTGIVDLTDSALTLAAIHNRKIIHANKATAQTITLPATAPVGFAVLVKQGGAGAVGFTAGSGATLRNRQSHTGIAGQYGVATLFVDANVAGTAAIWTLTGDTA